MPDPNHDQPSTGARRITSRRRYERLALTGCSIEIYRHVFFGMKEKAAPYRAMGIDLSEVGMRLSLPENLAIGEKLRIVAHIEMFKDTVEGECVVIWCVGNARVAGEFNAGIEWTSLTDGHFTKIQQMRKAMRSKEFQQKLRTKVRVEKEKSDGTDELEYKTPQY